MKRGLFDPVRGPVPRAHEAAEKRKVYTVGEITSLIRGALEERFGAVWVEGEVSNLSRPPSGHLYFTLKDETAQLQAVAYRGTVARFPFELRDGQELLVFGRITVYEPRGTHQIAVERVEPKGLGALGLRLQQLRSRLAAEGLFDPARKRPLPFLPRAIGIVTSPAGAAIQDITQVILRRFPRAHLVLRPVRVQGEGAAEEIARGVRDLGAFGGVDVIIAGRGGGSLEDLWAFNEEVVARAIAESSIPVISAVGHETDVSISDLVADVRALTPSEAGERVVPMLHDLWAELSSFAWRLKGALSSKLGFARSGLESLQHSHGLALPGEVLPREVQRLDELAVRLNGLAEEHVRRARERERLLAGRLEALNPLSVLARGYSITRRADGRRPVKSFSELEPGDVMITRFAKGAASSRVEEVRPKAEGQ